MDERRTWILASPHAGDNTQLLALADALGWPYEIKHLAYRKSEKFLRFLNRPTLAGVDRGRSDPISPPYPDLIIAGGRSAEAVSLWIRRYANPRVRLVFIGTPWGSPDNFDLVIATPQYRLPHHPNVLPIDLPLHALTPASLAAAGEAWLPHFQHLPQPWIAVLAGGDSGPYVFGRASAARLGEEASRLARDCGGSLLVTTSARTSGVAADALAAAISVPYYPHKGGQSHGENPFLAFLALAQKIIVTADSISMIAEACATGKPVLLFDTEEGKQSMRAEDSSTSADGSLPPPYWLGRNADSTAFRLAMRFGPPRWSRDLRIVHRNVVQAGLASWLGDPPRSIPASQLSDNLERSAARIRALFNQ
ncbi:hypothetical protein BH10PSE7_BH10PSE7_13950 [soil metagenome]